MNILKTNDCIIVGWHSSCYTGNFDSQLNSIIIEVNDILNKMGISYADMLGRVFNIEIIIIGSIRVQ